MVLKNFSTYDKITYNYERSDFMPVWLEYISFAITILSFFISIFTLVNTQSVKKQIVQKAEIALFKSEISQKIEEIEGFINSINENEIYKFDNKQNFKKSLSTFLTDVMSRYTFISKRSVKSIKNLLKSLDEPSLSNNQWDNIAKQLVILKNTLLKESVYYG